VSSHPACAPCAADYPLGSLGMTGIQPLTHAAIDASVTRTSAGNYALGYMDGATFAVFYVGRADADLKRCLHGWVDAPSHYERYAASTRAAWGSHRAAFSPLGAPALEHVESAESSYTHFAFSYAPSAMAAFEKQRQNFDDFGGTRALDNESEPVAGPR